MWAIVNSRNLKEIQPGKSKQRSKRQWRTGFQLSSNTHSIGALKSSSLLEKAQRAAERECSAVEKDAAGCGVKPRENVKKSKSKARSLKKGKNVEESILRKKRKAEKRNKKRRACQVLDGTKVVQKRTYGSKDKKRRAFTFICPECS